MSTTRTATPFVWYELMTTDHKAAFDFYSSVLGWTLAQSEFAGPDYTIANAGKFNVGGLMPLPAGVEMPPCWMMYLGTDDIDALVARVTAGGGKVTRPVFEIPGLGRLAVLADPHGAHFNVLQPLSQEPLPHVPEGAPGMVGWRELHANDGEQAMNWYAEQFGWKQTDAIDMGPIGKYRLFSITQAESEGGMMTRMPDTPVSFWTFYFNVEGIDAAVARVKAKGGNVLMDAHEVPGGQWIAYCSDPQGALFGLLASKR